jgi:hypothetical protein
MRRSRRTSTSICMIVIAIFNGYIAKAECYCKDAATRVGIYVTLSGDRMVAPGLLDMLNMQIWASLRPSQPGQPAVKFGCGMVERYSHGAPRCSQLVLGANVGRIGPDAVLQATLSTLKSNDHRSVKKEVWTVDLLGKVVSLGPIDELYSLPPVVIPEKIFSLYRNEPNIKLCQKPEKDCEGTPIGNNRAPTKLSGQEGEFDAESDPAAEFVKVELTDGTIGWLYLPYIGNRSEVVKFVAGVIRFLRGDYAGAVVMFQGIGGSETNAMFKINALLLQAVAEELEGRSGRKSLAAAAKLNPSLRTIFEVKVMIDLNEAVHTNSATQRYKLVESAYETLRNGDRLFDAGDPWYKDAVKAVENYRTELKR